MARRRSRGGEADEAEVNITPMLDMVFILLIFFIVTSSFANVTGLHVSRPTRSHQKVVKQSKIVLIQINRDNSITMDNRQLPLYSVRAEVEKDLATQPGAQVVVAASPASDAGILVQAIDQARQAGAKKVSIATTEG
ncbi:MAG: ExbD/TolR family protein [Gammaproteobacteria bacterium]